MDISRKDIFKISLFGFAIILVVILSLIFSNNNENNKMFKQYDYVYKISTSYSESELISDLPQININNSEINDLNNKILDNYYDIATRDYASYSYTYGLYNDLLILFITTNIYDDSQFGNINYYGYYIDVVNGKVLSIDEVLSKLNLNNSDIDKVINDRYKLFYDNDSLNKEYSFDEYIKQINVDDNYTLSIENNILYLYKKVNYTHDIEESDKFGDIYQFKVKELK